MDRIAGSDPVETGGWRKAPDSVPDPAGAPGTDPVIPTDPIAPKA